MKKLTVIIPFLNEGQEIENTILSILTTSKNSVKILLVNDCSTDDYNYSGLREKYDIMYHENKVRRGVAESRNI